MLDRVILSASDDAEGAAFDKAALEEIGLEVEIATADDKPAEGSDPGDEQPAGDEAAAGGGAGAGSADAATDDDNDEVVFSDATEKQKGRWAKRTAEREQLRSENAELKKKLEEKATPLPKAADATAAAPPPVAAIPPTVPEPVPFAEAAPVEPKKEDFYDDDDPQTAYLAAVAKYAAKQNRWEDRKEAWDAKETARVEAAKKAVADNQTSEQEMIRAARAKLDEQIAASRGAHTDFDTHVNTDKYSRGVMAVALDPRTCENGPEVLYYLATHPELLEKINAATSGTTTLSSGETIASLDAYNRAMREIAKIEVMMSGGESRPASTPSAVKTAQAPPAARIGKPPSQVGQGGAAAPAGEPDFEKMVENNDLEAYRAAKQKRAMSN